MTTISQSWVRRYGPVRWTERDGEGQEHEYLGPKQGEPRAEIVRWDDGTGSFLGLQLPDGSKVAVTAYLLALTPEDAVRAAADAAKAAAVAQIIDGARTIINAIKAGTLDYGTKPRNDGVKGLARAVLWLAKGEIAE
jgi:hypothetical protein